MGNSASNNPQHRTPPPAPTTRSRKKRSIVDHPALDSPSTSQPSSQPSQPSSQPTSSQPSSQPTSSQSTSSPQPPSSSPIPIPSNAARPAPPRRSSPPPANDSFALDLLQRNEHSTHRPIQYNSTRSFGPVRRGGVQGLVAPPPPAPPAPFVPELVHSSIPLRIPQAESPRGRRAVRLPGGRPDPGPSTPDSDDDNDNRFPTTVVWRGAGTAVFLAGTFDALEWRARLRLRFDPNTAAHTITLPLAPGTYRLKFIVDDTWRCSDDMPTATDDDTGNLVNYIDVDPPPTTTTSPNNPSASPTSERQARDARVMKANRRRTHPRYHPPQLPPAFFAEPDTDTELEAAGWGRGRDGVLEKWTAALPPPLVAAAQQEEAYAAAVQAQRDARRGGAGAGAALLPLGAGVPNVPPAPRLPRHLDKVLLNTRAPNSGSTGRSRSRSSTAVLLAPNLSASTRTMQQWAQADDSSVLPVPSHVVLHHLGTSAIKNGVLAVSDTTRYNKKYITTIYYKPA